MHELRVTSYFYCKSYKLRFAYELRVTTYCMSYEFLFICKLRVVIICMSYELLCSYELQYVSHRKKSNFDMYFKIYLLVTLFDSYIRFRFITKYIGLSLVCRTNIYVITIVKTRNRSIQNLFNCPK